MKKTIYITLVFLFSLVINIRVHAQYYTTDVVMTPAECGTGHAYISCSGGTPPYYFNWSDNGHGQGRDVYAGTYLVTIMDATGRDTNIYVTVTKERCPVSFAEVFTPNGDDINDVMGTGNFELYPNYQLQIFNRWGQKVHEQFGPKYIPWDGKQFGVNVPDESYYIIFYYDESKKDDVKTGSV